MEEVISGLTTLFIFVFIPMSIVILRSFKVIKQYERGVILTLGKYSGIRSPGLRIIIPVFQKMTIVDVRTNTIDVPKQEVITKDNVTVNVDAVVYFKVVAAEKATLEVSNFIYATSQFAQAALRDVTGNVMLDELLGKRDEISSQIKAIVDAQTDKWGIDVESVKIQNIELPQDMKRAMAKEAEAERERRAVIISAEGEKASALAVSEAAAMLGKTPGGINIRTLQTIEKIAMEQSQTTLFVLPSTLTDSFGQLFNKK